MNYKRIILINGTVETLSFFSMEMGKTFRKMGYELFVWDMSNPLICRDEFIKLPEKKSLLITFNFIGLCEESQFTFCNENGVEESLWDKFHVDKMCIMVDHPLYYYHTLEKSSGDITLFCVDRDHVDFMRKYHKKYERVYFLPLGGTEIKGDLEKDIDIVFAGNYVRMDKVIKRLEPLDEENKNFCLGIIDDLIANPEQTMDGAIIKHLLREVPGATREDILSLTHSLMVADLYVRSYFRSKIICYLAEQGFKIHIIGKDWEFSDCKKMENLIMHGEQDSLTCLKYMQRAKISLNIMPWFKNGTHDRIYNGMLQKCVVITDSSAYLEEELTDGKEVVFFKLGNYEKITDILNKLLSEKVLRNSISEQGYLLAKNKHLWENNVKEIILHMEELDEGFSCS